MLKNILAMRGRRIDDVMVPRADIVALGVLLIYLGQKGILEALPETDVSDLFAHLRALR